MYKSILVALLLSLSACVKGPVSTDDNGNTLVNGQPVEALVTTENAPPDPNIPESYTVSKICVDGTKIYLLEGGEASGRYGIWDGNVWELVDISVNLDTICESN